MFCGWVLNLWLGFCMIGDFTSVTVVYDLGVWWVGLCGWFFFLGVWVFGFGCLLGMAAGGFW